MGLHVANSGSSKEILRLRFAPRRMTGRWNRSAQNDGEVESLRAE